MGKDTPIFNESRRGLIYPGQKKRRCLKCGKSFESYFIGNRLCQYCKRENENMGEKCVANPVHMPRMRGRPRSNVSHT